jgi:hypothetical protein
MWDPRVSLPFLFFFFTFSRPGTAPPGADHAGALDGTMERKLARTLSRATPEPTRAEGRFSMGKPLLPLPVTRQARWQPLEAGHIADSARAPNPGAPDIFCPRADLTGRVCPAVEPSPACSPPTHLGFSPFLCASPQGKRRVEAGEEWRWGRKSRAPCRAAARGHP